MASRSAIKDSDGEREDDQDGGADDEDERGSPARTRKQLAGGRSRGQRFKAWFRDVRIDLYFLFFVGSIVLFVLGFLSVFYRRGFGPGLEAWFNSLSGANALLFLGGILCLLAAGYLFLGLILKRRHFERLIKTRAKSDFVRNLDKIERLAFELGTKESQAVADRKKEFKIRH
jgi:hypothetical protein